VGSFDFDRFLLEDERIKLADFLAFNPEGVEIMRHMRS
jgi:hypothetical protein